MYEFRINIHFPCSSYSVFTNSWQNSLAAKCSSVFLYQLPVTHSPVKLAGKNQQHKSIISETLAFGPETKTSNLNLNRAPWYWSWTVAELYGWNIFIHIIIVLFRHKSLSLSLTYVCKEKLLKMFLLLFKWPTTILNCRMGISFVASDLKSTQRGISRGVSILFLSHKTPSPTGPSVLWTHHKHTHTHRNTKTSWSLKMHSWSLLYTL